MEKLFLCAVFTRNELDVVDHQNIDGPKLFLERDGVAKTKCADKLVHELFGGEIDDMLLWSRLA